MNSTINNNETVIVKCTAKGNRTYAHDINGVAFTGQIPGYKRKEAVAEGHALIRKIGSTGRPYWRPVPMSEFEAGSRKINIPSAESMDRRADEVIAVDIPDGHENVLAFIHEDSAKLKPESLIMPNLTWKYLVRTAVRGKNIMMTGPSGSGKTMAAKALVNSMGRPDFYFNLGATQDPRATLIGNTHYNKDEGTYFSESLFVKAIQTENAIILLDELSRAHPEAWNILMTVLDEKQRYLRLDESKGQDQINVAKGVTFVATANIGAEYTSTRVMDRALLDRFTQIEMHVLNKDEELSLLSYLYPTVDASTLENVAAISSITRTESTADDARLSYGISTRTAVEIAGLLYDGFSLLEAAEVTIFPKFDSSGGAESERTFVKQLVQKYMGSDVSEDLFEVEEQEDN